MAEPQAPDRINDFVIKLATVNGTGSASRQRPADEGHLPHGHAGRRRRTIFPSNIQGLPTWYEIRVSRDGYVARAGHVDLMVAMNAETYAQDLAEVTPGGYLIYDTTWPRSHQLQRDDITILGMPLVEALQRALRRRAQRAS